MMRFYFEDHVGGNVATKCLRVGSNSSTHEVIDTLSEKFRPDMKMLTTSYSLYESHANKGNHFKLLLNSFLSSAKPDKYSEDELSRSSYLVL